MPNEFARVVPFTIERLGLTFTDRRDATAEDDEAARAGFRKWTIQEWNERQPVERRDCDDAPQIRLEVSRRWETWIEQNPDGTREQFEAAGLTVVDETCSDPRLLSLDLVARAPSGAAVGMWSLTNIVELDGSESAVEIRTMPMPGYPPGGFRHIPHAWGVGSRWLLENTIELADGMHVYVSELFFPDDDDSHAAPVEGNGMAQMWGEILNAAEEVETSSRGVPKRVRAL